MQFAKAEHLASGAWLARCRPWVEERDANPDWPAHVRITFTALGRMLGHEA